VAQVESAQQNSARWALPARATRLKSSPERDTLDEEQTVKLNFFKAPWSKVLTRLADETGATLVADKVPSGRYTRRDRAEYSRTDAVRLLNEELEPNGYRLLEKNDFLIVLDLRALRRRYSRPQLPQADAAAEESLPRRGHPQKPQKHERSTFTISPHQPNGELRDACLQAPSTSKGPNRPEDLSQTTYKDADDAKRRRNTETESHDEASNREAEVLTVVRPSRQPVKRLGNMLFAGFGARAELIDKGPAGLPAFRVYRDVYGKKHTPRGHGEPQYLDESTSFRDVLFTIGIDMNRQELLISAPPKLARELGALVRKLDAPPRTANEVIQLVAGDENTMLIARRLEPALNLLKTERSRYRTASRQPAANNGTAGEAGTESLPPRDAAEQPAAPGLSGLIGTLKGNVTVESLPGSGVLILRGNEKDVEAVKQVIEEILRLSEGAAPDIHLHRLQHVQSESLAALLNNVYQQLSTLRHRDTSQPSPVNVIAVGKPNAILILAPVADIKSILELVDDLDQPVDPNAEVEVFHLRSAIASQVIAMIEEVYQPDEEPAGLRPRFSAVADVRTNSIIVQASPNDLEDIGLLIKRIDRDETGSVNRMRIFPLKSAVAVELTDVINAAIQSVLNPARTVTGPGQDATQPTTQGGGGPSTQAFRDIKSVVLEFLSTEGGASRLVRSGILADIRVTADTRTNSLIVTAPEQSMELLEALIRRLDQPTTTVAAVKVFTLANGDAASMVEVLDSLFASTGGQDQLDVQLAAEDAGSSLIPLRFSVDVRTNSIIAVGGAEALRVVEAILFRLDQSDIRQRQSTVIRLNNSDAIEVAAALEDFLRSQRDLLQLDPEIFSNVELLEREIIVVPEELTNSLIISATPRYYEEILSLIEKLDEAPAQVIIQALLVEVGLENTDEFGVELGFQDSVLFDRGLLNLENFETIQSSVANLGTGVTTTTETIVNSEGLPGFPFNSTSQPLGNNTAINPSSVGNQGLSNLGLGRVNGDLGFGGLVLSASSNQVSVLLRALAARRSLHVLSRPQIRTLDNQPAFIQVGQQVPIVNGVTQNFGIVSPTVEPEDVGILLNVIPRITPDGNIVMEVIATKSGLAGTGVPIFVDAASGNIVESPIIDISEAQATVSVPNGQTIVMGGMITKTDATLERKVPWLGDVPGLGALFRYDATETRRTELLIFLTPRIIGSDVDSELIKQIEAERLHFIEEEAEKIHGPLFGVPPEEGADCDVLPPILHDLRTPAEVNVAPVPPLPGVYPDDPNVPTTVVPEGALQLPSTNGFDPAAELHSRESTGGTGLVRFAGGAARDANVRRRTPGTYRPPFRLFHPKRFSRTGSQ
jgi:type II secretion system protein D